MNKVKIIFLTVIILITSLAYGCSDNESDGSDFLFSCSLLGNPQNLDPQMATDTSSFTVIKNMYSGLLKLDSNGVLTNDIAKSYTISDDGLKYTFELRDNCYWYSKDFEDDEDNEGDEKIKVTAKDFVFAFQRIFNPQMQSPYSKDFICLKNAAAIINGAMDYTCIGVTAVSDFQLVIELDNPNANFLTLLTTPPAIPCHEEFFNSTKGRYGLDKDSVISNGSFYLTEWFYDQYGPENILIMRRNSFNSEVNRVYPSSLKFIIEKDYESQLKSFKDKKTDYILTDVYPDKFDKKDYTINEYECSTLGIIFNLNDEVYSNENIRRAFALSINREDLQSELKTNEVSVAGAIVPPNAVLLNKSYRELVAEEYLSEYNEDKAIKSLEDGMAELNISSLNTVKILVAENMMNSDYMHFFTQKWQQIFGVYIGFETVTQSEYEQKLRNGEYQMAISEMSGSYNSVFSILSNFSSEKNTFGYSSVETDNLLSSVESISSLSECVDIFRDIEKQIISDSSFIPIFYKKKYLIYRKTNADIVYYPFSGHIDFQYAKYFED